MKNFSLLAAILIIMSFPAFSQWEECNGEITTKKSIVSFAVKGNLIMAGSYNGKIFRSIDNGVTWKDVSINDKSAIVNSLIFSNDNNIIAGVGGGVYFSSDFGDSWEKRINGLNITDVIAVTICNNVIFAGTWGGGTYISSNNGQNWLNEISGLNNKNTESLISSGSYIFAGTENGLFRCKVNDYNWIKKDDDIKGEIAWCSEVSDNNIYVGTLNGIFISTDYGDSWKQKDINKLNCIFGISAKKNIIFTASYYGVYFSTDNGENWYKNDRGITDTLIYSIIIKDDYVFAGTDSKGIFRAKISDLLTDVPDNPSPSNLSFSIFPNPTSDNISISFPDSGLLNGSISICNSLGVEVKRINVLAGQNSINISTQDLQSGIYYCTYSRGADKITKSFAVVR